MEFNFDRAIMLFTPVLMITLLFVVIGVCIYFLIKPFLLILRLQASEIDNDAEFEPPGDENVVYGHFDAQKRRKNILFSKLRDGDYVLKRKSHYQLVIDGQGRVFSAVELSEIFGPELIIGREIERTAKRH